MSLCLYLLTQPRAQVDSMYFDLLPTRPTYLLIYLAYRNEWVSRESLAGLFWTDSTEDEARHNLRITLHRAKQLPWAKTLDVERGRVRFVIQTDVGLFRSAIAVGNWQQAVDLHQKLFLENLSLQDIGAFDQWVNLERQALLDTYRNAALQYTQILQKQENHSVATNLLADVLKHDLLVEDVIQAFIRSAYLSGQREAGIKMFERFAGELQTELGLEPMQATLDLIQHLRQSLPLEVVVVPATHKIPLEVLKPLRLIGRESEHAALLNSRLAVVSGEPGVGKTRLLTDVFPLAALIRCHQGLENIAYYPVLEYLKSNLESLPELGIYKDDLARLMPEISPGHNPAPAEPISAKSRLLEAFAQALEPVTRIVFDDLQWADEATLELLLYLGHRGKPLVAAYRSNELNPALVKTLAALREQDINQIALKPLSQATIQSLLADLIGIPTGPALFSEWLHQKSGGNPFFALETLKALFENGILQQQGNQWHTNLDDITNDYSELEVPTKILEMVRQRVNHLSEASIRVLQAASVIGQGFDANTLSSMIGLSSWAVIDGLEEAESGGLLKQNRFAHDLVRQSVYNAIPDLRCKMLHAQAAETLAKLAEASRVAEHYHRADQPTQAMTYWLKAADEYCLKGLQTQALDLLERIPQNPEVIALKVEALDEIGRFEEALETVKQTNTQDFNNIQKARLLHMQIDSLIGLGQIDQARQINDANQHVWNQLEPERDRRTFLLTQSKLAAHLGESQKVIDLLFPLLEGQPPQDASQVVMITSLGVAYDELGDIEKGSTLHHQALDLAKQLGARHLQVDVVLNLVWSATELSKIQNNQTPTLQAISLGEEALAFGEYAGSEVLRNNLAYIYQELEQFELAVTHYEYLTKQAHDPTLRCIAWARLPKLYAKLTREHEISNALKNAMLEVDQTQMYLAHVMVLIATLNYGSQSQIEHMLTYQKDQALDPWMQESLDRALSDYKLRRSSNDASLA
jgi:DNA-binding SARP family transcriptional activator/tetratricopeptide (TPR) repeat protein